jgi:hypothetical protein
MNTTQNQIPIEDISDSIVYLKNGSSALILQVSAVNFWLLSEREQTAIIYAYAQMLNSLSFTIQIVVLSERLDISSYIEVLNKAQEKQKNPLLSKLMVSYKEFIQKMIKENNVLDKKFFLIIPFYNLELGFKSSRTQLRDKARASLLSRKDQIVRSLARVGLDSVQIETRHIAALFYKIYNSLEWTETLSKPANGNYLNLNNPKEPDIIPTQSQTQIQTPAQTVERATAAQQSKNHPFVVEELEEN